MKKILAVLSVMLIISTCVLIADTDDSSASPVNYSITSANMKTNVSYTMNVGDTLSITETTYYNMHYGIVIMNNDSVPSIDGITFSRNASNTVGSGVYNASGTIGNGAAGHTYSIPIGHLHPKNNNSNTTVWAYITITVNSVAHNVYYDTQGGTSCPSSYGTTVSLQNTSRTGYSFAGWYTAASGGTYVGTSGSSYSPSSDITLYAHWSAISYTVSLNANGGSCPTSSVSASIISPMILPSATKPYSTFAGWFTDSSGGVRVGGGGDQYIPDSNVTLFAQYNIIPVTITSSQNNAYCVMGSSFGYNVSTTPSDAVVTVSGASWLSVSGHSVVGTPTLSNAAAGTYHVSVTATYGTQSSVQTFDVIVVEKLSFESIPTGGIIATPA